MGHEFYDDQRISDLRQGQSMRNSQAMPGADEARRKLIVGWHARGHDALDGYDIPRFEDGMEYTIAERIELLAGRPPAPRPAPDITGATDA